MRKRVLLADDHAFVSWGLAKALSVLEDVDIVGSVTNGIDAIDGPFADFRDAEGYRRECTWATTLGAVGKWAIHPSQVEIANEVFAPSEREVERAKAIVEKVREAESAGAGAANDNGVMIDAATARIFEATLERARLMGKA